MTDREFIGGLASYYEALKIRIVSATDANRRRMLLDEMSVVVKEMDQTIERGTTESATADAASQAGFAEELAGKVFWIVLAGALCFVGSVAMLVS